MLVIVPDSLYNEIQAKLDTAFVKMPDAERDRDCLYRQLLFFFNEHGFLPDFEVVKKDSFIA